MQYEQGQEVRVAEDYHDPLLRGQIVKIQSVIDRKESESNAPGTVISYWVESESGALDICDAGSLRSV